MNPTPADLMERRARVKILCLAVVESLESNRWQEQIHLNTRQLQVASAQSLAMETLLAGGTIPTPSTDQ